MKVTFLTEMNFEGKIPSTHPNMRTEFAWMNALDADHSCIHNFKNIKNQDHVFIIIPKGEVFLNAVGVKLSDKINPISKLLELDIVPTLKSHNNKVHYIQEGPSWLFNDYEISDQLNFYNTLSECDSIFAHNKHDAKFYQGLFPSKRINVMPTLLIEDLIKNIIPQTEDKVIVGGNFARWYGGFQGYLVANEFNIPIWTQESHARRENERDIADLNHLPQRVCHPNLSVDVDDVEKARILANRLNNDKEFHKECSVNAKNNYHTYYGIDKYKESLINQLT